MIIVDRARTQTKHGRRLEARLMVRSLPHLFLTAFFVGRPSQVKRNGNAASDFRGEFFVGGVVGILGQMPLAQPPHFPAEIAEYVIKISRVFEESNGISLCNLQN